MEEVIEEGLKTLQKWEGDRLRAVKTGELRSQFVCIRSGGRSGEAEGRRERKRDLTRRDFLLSLAVLGEFQRITGESLVALKGVQDTSALLLDSFVPESDLAAT